MVDQPVIPNPGFSRVRDPHGVADLARLKPCSEIASVAPIPRDESRGWQVSNSWVTLTPIQSRGQQVLYAMATHIPPSAGVTRRPRNSFRGYGAPTTIPNRFNGFPVARSDGSSTRLPVNPRSQSWVTRRRLRQVTVSNHCHPESPIYRGEGPLSRRLLGFGAGSSTVAIGLVLPLGGGNRSKRIRSRSPGGQADAARVVPRAVEAGGLWPASTPRRSIEARAEREHVLARSGQAPRTCSNVAAVT